MALGGRFCVRTNSQALDKGDIGALVGQSDALVNQVIPVAQWEINRLIIYFPNIRMVPFQDESNIIISIIKSPRYTLLHKISKKRFRYFDIETRTTWASRDEAY
jgi:hypothetical protein